MRGEGSGSAWPHPRSWSSACSAFSNPAAKPLAQVHANRPALFSPRRCCSTLRSTLLSRSFLREASGERAHLPPLLPKTDGRTGAPLGSGHSCRYLGDPGAAERLIGPEIPAPLPRIPTEARLPYEFLGRSPKSTALAAEEKTSGRRGRQPWKPRAATERRASMSETSGPPD